MSKSLKQDFHENVYTNLATFIKIIKALAANPDIRDAVDNMPESSRDGRTAFQIIMDDALDAFGTIMRDVPDSEIPVSFHRQLLKAREGRSVSDAFAKKDLQELMEDSRALPPTDQLNGPQFVDLLTETVPQKVMLTITKNWVTIINMLGQLTLSDQALASIRESRTIIANTTQSLQDNLVKVALDDANLKKLTDPSSAAANDDESAADEAEEEKNFLDELINRVATLDLSPDAKKMAKKELAQLKAMNPQSSEYSVLTKHLDVLTSMPWGKISPVTQDLKRAEEILDEDHYGMKKVKEAIAEHVAVQNRLGTSNGKIILLVGPPGVGKTSIAQSVAKATGRAYVRMALGGVRDEANIRGHKMTYVGAMPGDVVKSMIKAGSMNPLIVLDEVDKMGQHSSQGDPTAALLEALDPEQNHAFRDHYLDVEFDLSNVMFFCTANDFGSIPGPLRDRMEVIHLPGYLHDEKFEIAKRYLAPKQLKKNGLTATDVTIDDSAIHRIINEYTREAGVRRLEQVINRVLRKAVVAFAKGATGTIHVTADNLTDYAGASKGKQDMVNPVDEIGVVNGLAYTSVGGVRLPIQCEALPSNSGFRLSATGSLGDVMKESIRVAEGWVIKHAAQYGIHPERLKNTELRLHAPDGSTPKDGPSAGLAMATVIISALTGIKIRHDLAMTGEIDLKGNAGQIGGLPEKLEGALRAGVKTVLIPRDNVGDLADVPDSIKSHLEIIAVDTIDDVIKHTLTEAPPSLEEKRQQRTLAEIFKEIQALTAEAAALSARSAENDNSVEIPKKVANGPSPS